MLAEVAAMPVREWNYKAQERPSATSARPHRTSTPPSAWAKTRCGISTIDADGVALAARPGARGADARDQRGGSRRENDELRARLARLEALLDKR